MTTRDPVTTREWMDLGTALFLGAVDRLRDEDFGTATALPGWTRAHVVAHAHYNAEALIRLLHWARTGERTPMYAGTGQRNAEIETGAQLPPAELRALVHSSADALTAAIDGLPEEAWSNEVVTAQGRTVPASEVVWMRTREVAVHAIDLANGVAFSDLPDELNTALIVDAVMKRSAGGQAAVLAEWLTERSTDPPSLGPWL
ncbi:MAG: maleylpyruvate isomerase N-terminal domain-containing protein [Nocardioidaceae bacterium]